MSIHALCKLKDNVDRLKSVLLIDKEDGVELTHTYPADLIEQGSLLQARENKTQVVLESVSSSHFDDLVQRLSDSVKSNNSIGVDLIETLNNELPLMDLVDEGCFNIMNSNLFPISFLQTEKSTFDIMADMSNKSRQVVHLLESMLTLMDTSTDVSVRTTISYELRAKQSQYLPSLQFLIVQISNIQNNAVWKNDIAFQKNLIERMLREALKLSRCVPTERNAFLLWHVPRCVNQLSPNYEWMLTKVNAVKDGSSNLFLPLTVIVDKIKMFDLKHTPTLEDEMSISKGYTYQKLFEQIYQHEFAELFQYLFQNDYQFYLPVYHIPLLKKLILTHYQEFIDPKTSTAWIMNLMLRVGILPEILHSRFSLMNGNTMNVESKACKMYLLRKLLIRLNRLETLKEHQEYCKNYYNGEEENRKKNQNVSEKITLSSLISEKNERDDETNVQKLIESSKQHSLYDEFTEIAFPSSLNKSIWTDQNVQRSDASGQKLLYLSIFITVMKIKSFETPKSNQNCTCKAKLCQTYFELSKTDMEKLFKKAFLYAQIFANVCFEINALEQIPTKNTNHIKVLEACKTLCYNYLLQSQYMMDLFIQFKPVCFDTIKTYEDFQTVQLNRFLIYAMEQLLHSFDDVENGFQTVLTLLWYMKFETSFTLDVKNLSVQERFQKVVGSELVEFDILDERPSNVYTGISASRVMIINYMLQPQTNCSENVNVQSALSSLQQSDISLLEKVYCKCKASKVLQPYVTTQLWKNRVESTNNASAPPVDQSEDDDQQRKHHDSFAHERSASLYFAYLREIDY